MEDMSMDQTHMFWGVVLKPEKRYEQMVEEPFHISKACIEPSTSKGAITSVFIEVEDEEFLICNLSEKILNETLDLNFNVGDKIVFKTTGSGIVHLTGYNVMEDGPEDMYDDSDEEGSEEEESEDEQVPELVNGKKRKNVSSASDESMPAKKSNKQPSPLDKLLAEKRKENGLPSPKAEKKKAEEMRKKIAETSKKVDDEDLDDDSDEDDLDEEEESDDDDDGFINDEADEVEEEEEEDDDDEDEEMESPKKMNGTPAKAGDKKKQADAKNGKSPEKAPEESGDATQSAKKKKKKNKKKKNKENANETINSSESSSPAKGEQKTPSKDGKGDQKTPAKDSKAQNTPGKTPKRTLKGGLVVEDLKAGDGPEAKRGKMVGMYYKGTLKTNNKTFDSNLSGKPFKFRLGAGEVIKGWDIGVEGMKVGGKRRLVVPPSMAYGAKGAMPDIPPNATLVFDVECKAVN